LNVKVVGVNRDVIVAAVHDSAMWAALQSSTNNSGVEGGVTSVEGVTVRSPALVGS
jgi:hypothetical protein